MLTNATTSTVPFHLTGAFAPVLEEREDNDLEVIGALPPDLCGTYLRNGPNPRTGQSPAWFAAEGMLHGIRLESGRARWHRNRWIAAPRAPNTNVVRHGGRVLALVETRGPVEVTTDLNTVGTYDFDGMLDGAMTAHPKVCPRTSELLFFGGAATKPHLTYYRADASGRIVHRAPIDVPVWTFMHDFAITEHYAVFYILPVVISDWRAPVPLRWDPTLPARIGVIPRDGTNADIRWFDVAPFTISHVVNAFEEGDDVVLDAVRAPKLMAPHSLYRFTVNMSTGGVTERTLDERFLDFPRVHPRFVGARHRHAYAIEIGDFTADGGFRRTRAHKVDVDAGTSVVHDAGEGSMPGECIVIPRAGSRSDDDGWAMMLVHQQDGSSTELHVFDAARFNDPPVARVRLRGRVPFGLHGEWMADER